MARIYAPCWLARGADVLWFEEYHPDVTTAFNAYAFNFPGTCQSTYMNRLQGHETPVRMTADDKWPTTPFMLAYSAQDDFEHYRARFWHGLSSMHPDPIYVLPQRRHAILLEGTDCGSDFFDAAMSLIEGLGFVDTAISGLFDTASSEPYTEYFAVVLGEQPDPSGELRARVHTELAQLKF